MLPACLQSVSQVQLTDVNFHYLGVNEMSSGRTALM